MLAFVILVVAVFPLVPILILSFIPGPAHPGIDGVRGRRWRAAWKWSFVSLIAVDIATVGVSIFVEKSEAAGYALITIALFLALALSVTSFAIARYVGRQPWAWAICGLLSFLPSSGCVAFGVIGFAAIRRALSGPIFRGPFHIKVRYATAIFLVVASSLLLGIGHLLYESVKDAKPLHIGIYGSYDRIVNVAKEVLRENEFTIEESGFSGIVLARESTIPTRYYEISTLGSRDGLEQLYVIRMDSKKSFWALPMSGGQEMLPISSEARRLFDEVKIRVEQGKSGK